MKAKFLLYSLMAVTLMYACKKADVTTAPVTPVTSSEKVKVKVTVGGDITSTTSPISNGRTAKGNAAAKYLTDSTVYAVGVNISGRPYAQGVFNTTNSFDLEVPKGATYVINVAAFKKGTGYGMLIGGTSNGYQYYGVPMNQSVKNAFDYADPGGTLYTLSSDFLDTLAYIPLYGNMYLNTIETFYYSHLDSYFYTGTFQATDSSSALTIPLKRISFGIQYAIHNLTDGFLVADFDSLMAEQEITDTTVTNMRIYTADSFRWSDTLLYKPVHLTLKWQHYDGTSQALGDKYLKVQRNQLTTVTVNLPSPGSSNPGGDSGNGGTTPGNGSFSIGVLNDAWLGNTIINF
jgi:hypothetical protein